MPLREKGGGEAIRIQAIENSKSCQGPVGHQDTRRKGEVILREERRRERNSYLQGRRIATAERSGRPMRDKEARQGDISRIRKGRDKEIEMWF